mgnify:CR=1 FL=1
MPESTRAIGPPALSRDRAEDLARQALVRGADLAGSATQRWRALPELLICGGQRCGTTSMYKALIQQPTILRPTWRKGVHYFDVAYPGHSLDWYRRHFPLRAQLDLAAQRAGDHALTFESSPYYLFHPLALDRIARDLPQVRLLVLVRDPVERAYSAHAHELARGYEELPFAESLAAEESRLAGEVERLVADPAYESHAHRHQAYRSRGEYASQLERAAQLIGRERIHVVDSHRFFAEPEAVLDGVLDFVGVKGRPVTRFERHNARPRLPLDPGLARELRAHYRPHDEALTRWLGRAPSWAEESS